MAFQIGAKELAEANQPQPVERDRPQAGILASNAAFRKNANRRNADRRDRNARNASKRERIERQKELEAGPMSVAEFNAAVDAVRDSFGIVLESNWGGFTTRPTITTRELMALAAGVEDGTTYRDRVIAVNRLRKLGFRVSFTEDGPKPSAADRLLT